MAGRRFEGTLTQGDMFRIIKLLKLSYNLQVKTKENTIVDAFGYQIPVNQLELGRYRYIYK